MRSPEEAFCMTLLSESYYCVRSVLNFNMDFSANLCRCLQLHRHLTAFSTFTGIAILFFAGSHRNFAVPNTLFLCFHGKTRSVSTFRCSVSFQSGNFSWILIDVSMRIEYSEDCIAYKFTNITGDARYEVPSGRAQSRSVYSI